MRILDTPMRGVCLIWMSVYIPAVLATEVCQFETFNASCPTDEVIIMHSSWYGRMHAGKCIKTNFGYVGCYKDVLPITHRRCSGKQKCNLDVPDKEMAGTLWHTKQTCPDDLMLYLAANYTCQKVVKPKSKCQGNERITLSGSGNVSSYVSRTTQCGSTDSPLIIQGEVGQVVKIGAIDYGINLDRTNTLSIGDTLSVTRGQSRGGSCNRGHVYAIIKDVVVTKSHTICGGGQGINGEHIHEYTSQGHQIEVRVLGREDRRDAREFLLTYEVTGCPNIPVGLDGTWTREGDKATFSCASDSNVYKVLCKGERWTGRYQNCSLLLADAARGASILSPNGSSGLYVNLTTGLGLVLICSIAFVVGIFIVVVGILIIRRQQFNDVRRRAAVMNNHNYTYPTCVMKDGAPQQHFHPNHNPVHKMTSSQGGMMYNTSTGSRLGVDDNTTHMSDNSSIMRQSLHEHDYAYVDEHIISGLRPQSSYVKVPVPPQAPALPASNNSERAGLNNINKNNNTTDNNPHQQNQNIARREDTVSLPDFDYLSQAGYNTLDSRNFSALERESQRNRAHNIDDNHEARYS